MHTWFLVVFQNFKQVLTLLIIISFIHFSHFYFFVIPKFDLISHFFTWSYKFLFILQHPTQLLPCFWKIIMKRIMKCLQISTFLNAFITVTNAVLHQWAERCFLFLLNHSYSELPQYNKTIEMVWIELVKPSQVVGCLDYTHLLNAVNKDFHGISVVCILPLWIYTVHFKY